MIESIPDSDDAGEPADVVCETAFLAEAASSDWNRPEEDAAWAYLQPTMSPL